MERQLGGAGGCHSPPGWSARARAARAGPAVCVPSCPHVPVSSGGAAPEGQAEALGTDTERWWIIHADYIVRS